MNNSIPDTAAVQIQLNHGYVTFVNAVDADLGKGPRKWIAYVSPHTVYAYRTNQRLHRIIVERVIGRKLTANDIVDHIDGDGLNNRRSNLRLATPSQNAGNSRIRSNNTSGYKGVCFISGKWVAQITYKSNPMTLGRFDDILDAARAYNAGAIKYFGKFARLNVIPDES
jgi:hypothetical protein